MHRERVRERKRERKREGERESNYKVIQEVDIYWEAKSTLCFSVLMNYHQGCEGWYSSSSSGRTNSTYIHDSFSPPLSIVYRFRQVFRDTSCIGTVLLYLGSSWSSCFCSSMWRRQQEYVLYEFVPASPAVSCISGSSDLDSFRDGWEVTVQLLLCRVLTPEFIQYYSHNSCVVAVKLFLHTFS